MSPIGSTLPSLGIPSALNSGIAAIATGSQQLSQDAQQIANPANENFTDPLVDSTQAVPLTEAGAEVIRTSNQMLGSLLDVFA
jgi:outer membrane receptor for monomeric catechols